ncbi:MAG: LysE family translocator [Acidiferrobacteraceae bacterium]
MVSLFLGLIIGIVISAPIGPVGLFTIQRILTQGRVAGIVSGAGAATADTFYGGLAALGLSAVSGFLANDRIWIYMGAGVLCFWVGLRAIFFRPMRKAKIPHYSSRGLIWDYASSVLLALANPLTILFFIVTFTVLHLDHTGTEKFLLTVIGIFTGCLLSWTFLAIMTTRFRAALDSRLLTRINRISAAIIVTLGVFAILSAVRLFIVHTR